MMGLSSSQVKSGKTLIPERDLAGNNREGFSKVIGKMLTGAGEENVEALSKEKTGADVLQSSGGKESLTQLQQLLEELDGNIKETLKEALTLKNNGSQSLPVESMTEDSILGGLLNAASSDELSVLQKLLSTDGESDIQLHAEEKEDLSSLMGKLEKLFSQSEETVPATWGEVSRVLETVIKPSNTPNEHSVNQFFSGNPYFINNQQTKNADKLETKLTDLFKSFQQVIQAAGESNQLTNEQLKKIKDLLTSYVKASESRNIAAGIENLNGTRGEKSLFEQLLTNVSRKQQMPSAYNQQQISLKDMAKWMTQATSKINTEEMIGKQTGQESKTTMSHQMPMSRVEQLVIRVDQQSSTPAQKQVFQQMQEMIQSSRMFMDKAGNQQMQIKLNPASLGEMTIKFTQISGEMAVKIMVTSQAAKEMLEGNMQQLRHMFSPQQVVVEKTDQNLSQQFLSEEETESFGDKEEETSEHNFEDEPEDEENTGEALSFSDILNEKV